jgi:F-type H+-transporting ATPase subunit epsilon
MAKTFPFEVHTPSHLFFKDAVQMVIVTLTDGDIAILAGHEACIAPVKIGFLKVKDDDGVWKTAFVADGILEVKDHKTVLMSDAAEWGNEIDHDKALKEKVTAEETLKNATFKFETDKAVSSLRKAEYRLKVWEMANANV